MSRAFIKESEGEWLGDVQPDIAALERYLTRENGERVFEVHSYRDPKKGKDVHEMSNGDLYVLNMDNRWERHGP